MPRFEWLRKISVDVTDFVRCNEMFLTSDSFFAINSLWVFVTSNYIWRSLYWAIEFIMKITRDKGGNETVIQPYQTLSSHIFMLKYHVDSKKKLPKNEIKCQQHWW